MTVRFHTISDDTTVMVFLKSQFLLSSQSIIFFNSNNDHVLIYTYFYKGDSPGIILMQQEWTSIVISEMSQ